MKWFKRIHLLYLFGFFSNFRPADPYLYEFFVERKKFPVEEVQQDILPVLSYSTAIHLVFVFFFCDLCGYKALIIMSAVATVVATSIRILTDSIFVMEISEVFRGTAAAAELAYYIYIYGYYDVMNYQRTTAYVRTAALVGKITSSALSQLIIFMEWLNYNELQILNLSANSLAGVFAVFLPTAGENAYYLSTSTNPPEKFSSKLKQKILAFKSTFIESFHQKHIIRWSIWCACSICSYVQVSTFVQPLWKVLETERYNGAAEASLGLVALLAVSLAGFKKIDWKLSTVVVMYSLSGLQYVVLLSSMALWNGYFVIFHYVDYVLFGAIYYFVITAISPEIAQLLHKNCFGLVFGFIYLLAAILNTIMVCVINDNAGFKLEPKQQFYVYFVVHLSIYVIFVVASAIKKKVDTVMTRH
ncbi:folate transporter 1-like [Tenebrio molitor]|uniref:folate transporter 1-like n=1 Tax=Tenebrio molitor TaxID=7067 RepID=UPI0036247FF6